ncbi:MAG: EAL domain-containing protein (putative c-di-GMP-specific phosphodiesterase class I) [Planctomycetota bacterium]
MTAISVKSAFKCASWRAHGIEVPIAVNLSAKILDNSDLPEKIKQLLDKWQLPAEMLTLEVTETGALARQEVAAKLLFELAGLGVQIPIDDFGSGFTSFRYLRDFTIHELKIDQMSVDDLVKGKRDESIIKSMLELGKGFGVKVVAEGIEDKTTLERLKALNCEYGQGYLFSGAMHPNQFVVWASDWAIKCRSASTKAPWLD